MKKYWKKTAAGFLAMLFMAGASPVMPVTNSIQKATVTASAEGESESITYIDENGAEQTISNYTVFNGSTNRLTDGWYLVNSTCKNMNTMTTSGNVNIILADDCTMELGAKDRMAFIGSSGTTTNLNIYGQSKGTGKLVLTSETIGLSVNIEGSLTINSGTWSSEGIYIIGKNQAEDCFTINGGNINIGGSDFSVLARDGKCSINGGQVSLEPKGGRSSIDSQNGVSLGYTKTTDYIYTYFGLSSNYNVSIADGKIFTDGTKTYDSNTPSNVVSALSHVTLKPANVRNVKVMRSEHGTVTANESVFVGDTVMVHVTPDAGYRVKSVKYNNSEARNSAAGLYSFTMPNENVTVTAEFEQMEITDVSVSLGEELGLNFYMISGVTDENADDYTVRFSGKCLEDETILFKNKKTGKYYAPVHVYAKDLHEKIVAQLYKNGKLIYISDPYSVEDYLNNASETVTETNALSLINATKAFGNVSAEYFYGGSYGFADAFNAYVLKSGMTEKEIKDYVCGDEFKPDFTSDEAMLSLVLDEKTAIRLYVKGVEPYGGKFKPNPHKNNGEYPSYYEITGLTPEKLADEQTVNVNGKSYKFSALSWANRVLTNSGSSGKNVNMAKAVTAYYLAADKYKHTVDISALAGNYTAKNGDILTGTTNRRIEIGRNATVTLKNAEINGEFLYCSDKSTIILEGTNKACVQINNGTLTIDGEGSLIAEGRENFAGINGNIYSNLVINSGNITATGGTYSAGIGGCTDSGFGNITINGGTVTANGESSPGIGTGSGWRSSSDTSVGNIIINGGTVTASGGYNAAGIGSGGEGKCGNITIAETVTKVTATKGGNVPNSIGAGSHGTCGTITIGGIVYHDNGAYVNGGYTYLTQDTIVYEPNKN